MTSKRLRDDLVFPKKRICIKLSSLAVTLKEGGINHKQLNAIVLDIAKLIKEHNFSVVIVCSGAINAGRPLINAKRSSIESMQAASAVGQPILLQEISKRFKKKNMQVAQVLLTHEDFKSRSRSLNTKQCLETLLNSGIIPVVNENDTVSFSEITLGDNDQLSAMTCELLGMDLLCMLTHADGLYTDNPQNPGAVKLKTVEYADNFNQVKLFNKTSTGTGGMKTKLLAVRKLTPLGIPVIISSFLFSKSISRVLYSKKGTLFLANNAETRSKKKTWIITRVRSNCVINIDQGAMEALRNNASLLLVGIVSTKGQFTRGDCISISHRGRVMSYGVTEYSSSDIERMSSEKSKENQKNKSNLVIHKNNLVLK